MLRTRDYFLVLISIAFLLIGIGTTVADSYRQSGLFDSNKPLEFTLTDSEQVRTATIFDTETDSRAQQLASLRQKIAAGGLLLITETTPESNVTATTTEELIVALPEDQLEQRCPGYQAFNGTWSSGVRFEEVEGARVFYVENNKTVPPLTASTTPPIYTSAREVLVELPLRSFSLGAQNCISSDVIGIARDGSLIRNTNVSIYAIFSSETVVGYALDGYPIYGNGNTATDSCGGTTVGGQYRYQISSERAVVLSCYSGVAVQL